MTINFSAIEKPDPETISRILYIEQEAFGGGALNEYVVVPLLRYGKVYAARDEDDNIVASAYFLRDMGDIGNAYLMSVATLPAFRGEEVASALLSFAFFAFKTVRHNPCAVNRRSRELQGTVRLPRKARIHRRGQRKGCVWGGRGPSGYGQGARINLQKINDLLTLYSQCGYIILSNGNQHKYIWKERAERSGALSLCGDPIEAYLDGVVCGIFLCHFFFFCYNGEKEVNP